MILRDNSGAALVELALSLTILLTIVFGIFEFGRAMYITNTLNNAARDGARRAVVSSVPLDVGGLKTKMKENIPLSADELSALVITINAPPLLKAGDTVTVTTELEFTPATPLLSFCFPKPFNLHGSASMRYE